MVPQDLINRLPNDGYWGIFATIVIAIWLMVKAISKADTDKMDKSLGWFGRKISRIIQWFKDSEQRQIEHEQQLQDTRVRVFEDKISSLEAMIKRDRQWYECQLNNERVRNTKENERLEARIEKEVQERQLIQSWMEYAMQWASDVYSLAVRHAWDPPFDPLMSFSMWRRLSDGRDSKKPD